MTALLEKAIQKAKKLKKEEQDELATILLEELEDESRWHKAFAKSQNQLGKLADEARAEFLAGKTEKMNL